MTLCYLGIILFVCKTIDLYIYKVGHIGVKLILKLTLVQTRLL